MYERDVLVLICASIILACSAAIAVIWIWESVKYTVKRLKEIDDSKTREFDMVAVQEALNDQKPAICKEEEK